PAYQALALLDGGVWPLVGQPSSVFLDNPALMPYLQALPLLLYRSPVAVQFFVLAVNSTAIWFVWRLATDLLGRPAGWIAALLFAANPWVVFFSRMTWVQSLVPFFMAVIAWGLWPAFIDDRADPRRFFIGGVAVTLMAQTYVQAWGILPQIAFLLCLFRHRVPKRAFLVSGSIFLFAALSYAFGLSTRAGTNIFKAGSFMAEGWQGLSSIGLRHAIRFINGVDFRPTYAAGNPSGSFWHWLSLLFVILLTAGLIAGFVRAGLSLKHTGRERRLGIVLLSWFLIPVLLTSLEGAFDIHPHYLMLTLPAGHLLAAWGVAPLLRTRIRPVVIVMLLLVGLVFAHDLYRANELVERRAAMPELDGWSLAAGGEIGRTVREMALSFRGPYPRRIVAGAGKELMSGLSATYLQPVQGVQYPDFILLAPDSPLLYVIEGSDDISPALRDHFDLASMKRLRFSQGPQITIAKTRPAAAVQINDQPAILLEWPSDSGLTLVGYTLDGTAAPGHELNLTSYWRVDQLSPDRAEWYVASYYHLVGDVGQIISNVGVHGQWAHRWELGDVYIENVTIPVPADANPGNHHLEMGLFDSVNPRTYSFFKDGTPVP
ncbi:MAG TPA: glycosyltransferase family 39 protein, partial [Promineifilum sp.]